MERIQQLRQELRKKGFIADLNVKNDNQFQMIIRRKDRQGYPMITETPFQTADQLIEGVKTFMKDTYGIDML